MYKKLEYLIEFFAIFASLVFFGVFFGSLLTFEGGAIYFFIFLSYVLARFQSEKLLFHVEELNKKIPDNHMLLGVGKLAKTNVNEIDFCLEKVRNRLKHTGSIASASEYSRSLLLSIREEFSVELSTTRYFVWFIPTLGFIGTIIGIRGVFQGLPEVLKTMSEESILQIVEPFGVAFDTTLVSLALTSFLVFKVSNVDKGIDGFILSFEKYINDIFLKGVSNIDRVDLEEKEESLEKVLLNQKKNINDMLSSLREVASILSNNAGEVNASSNKSFDVFADKINSSLEKSIEHSSELINENNKIFSDALNSFNKDFNDLAALIKSHYSEPKDEVSLLVKLVSKSEDISGLLHSIVNSGAKENSDAIAHGVSNIESTLLSMNDKPVNDIVQGVLCELEKHSDSLELLLPLLKKIDSENKENGNQINKVTKKFDVITKGIAEIN